MPPHVENGSSHKLGGHESLVEIPRYGNLGNETVGNSLAALVMMGIGVQHLRYESPVLVDL